MIQELNGKTSFFQNDPLYKKYFCNKEKTELEKNKELELYSMVCNFFKKIYNFSPKEVEKLSDPYYISFGAYLDDYGFYTQTYQDRGYHNIECYGTDINIAFLRTVDELLFDLLLINQNSDCKQNIGKFTNLFTSISKADIKTFGGYLSQEGWIIDKWNKYYEGEIPEYIVSYYEENINDFIWRYDGNIKCKYNNETKKFDINKKGKVRKLHN